MKTIFADAYAVKVAFPVLRYELCSLVELGWLEYEWTPTAANHL